MNQEDILGTQAWNLMWYLVDRLAAAKDQGHQAQIERLQPLTNKATTRWLRRTAPLSQREVA